MKVRDDERVYLWAGRRWRVWGAFKATKGLIKNFGTGNEHADQRRCDGGDPLAPRLRVRPIVEMLVDFSSIALNQILNNALFLADEHAGSHHGSSAFAEQRKRPFHSQSMESIYAHYPGLIVMTPATVEDVHDARLKRWPSMIRLSTASTSISIIISRPTNCRLRACPQKRIVREDAT